MVNLNSNLMKWQKTLCKFSGCLADTVVTVRDNPLPSPFKLLSVKYDMLAAVVDYESSKTNI